MSAAQMSAAQMSAAQMSAAQMSAAQMSAAQMSAAHSIWVGRFTTGIRDCVRGFLLALVGVTGNMTADEPTPSPLPPKIAPASDEAIRARTGFQLPQDFQASLFAAEPLVANPVSFFVNHAGRVYVCESFRQNAGVTDNRGH